VVSFIRDPCPHGGQTLHWRDYCELTQPGEAIAAQGLEAHEPAMRRLAEAVRHSAPAAAALLDDTAAQIALRERAFAVAASHCLS
jgi:hypothetical protein